ncbi:unnamed protein product [Durusdinium trenchii]|uniref:Ion transport domain-containing protein n=1 Tax=Durusdinium trenchii TaxID=1381693 RepID=A0ABP0P9X0_9DINO
MIPSDRFDKSEERHESGDLGVEHEPELLNSVRTDQGDRVPPSGLNQLVQSGDPGWPGSSGAPSGYSSASLKDYATSVVPQHTVVFKRGSALSVPEPGAGDAAARARLQTTPRRKGKPMQAMDLKVAWQLQAREALTDPNAEMDPMMRLVTRTRADWIRELLEDPNSSNLAFAISWVFQLFVLLSISLDYTELIDPGRLDALSMIILNVIFDAFFFGEVMLRLLA